VQFPVWPMVHAAHVPQLIWNGTTTRWPGRTLLTLLTHREDLGDALVPEAQRQHERRLAQDQRAVEVAGGDGDRVNDGALAA
jgi:hypothetical protein